MNIAAIFTKTTHHLMKSLHKNTDSWFIFIKLVLKEENSMMVLLMEQTEESLDAL